MSEKLDYAEGYDRGLTSMKKMVLRVFNEHPEMTTEQIKNYIKDNL